MSAGGRIDLHEIFAAASWNVCLDVLPSSPSEDA
jgi:hypothetical protein